MYDIIVIGGGIVGCSVIRELARYDLSVLMLEKCEDVACGCTKANSGIVHAGYDAIPGTLKAKFNVLGNAIYSELAKELGVPYEQIGSLVLADKTGLPQLQELFERGAINGVPKLAILNREQLLQIEPNIADNIQYGLYAPTAGIVSPYEMAIAMAEQAVVNGVKVVLDAYVSDARRIDGGFIVTANDQEYKAKVVINCAGYGADVINEKFGGEKFEYKFTRGDYYVFDNVERFKFNHTCFPLPDERGKGCLVSPTADGNIIAGPTSIKVATGTDTAVKKEGLDYIKQSVARIVKNVNFGKSIRVFAGVRVTSGDDFVIRTQDNLLTLAGICSPGLTSAPAIAQYVISDMLPNTSLKNQLKLKVKFLPREIKPVTRNLTKDEWAKLIKQNRSYAKIVCRCEKITEGEILDALNSPLLPKSLDALKRRVRTGMGRCQGGFCTSRIMELINAKFGIPFEQITKKGKGSEVVISRIKEVDND